AELLLSVGNVVEATKTLDQLNPPGKNGKLADGLRELVAAVKHTEYTHTGERTLATEWMAGSYYEQSRSHLDAALAMAKKAAATSPQFGFAHARVAELEFSFGHTDEAMAALSKALQFSPENAQAHAL